ncbi:MAG TPA: hypothetical protein VKC51_05190 [Lacunisphaera sp.]|nr:hypothetical protein [Lacunisphaera sp.]
MSTMILTQTNLHLPAAPRLPRPSSASPIPRQFTLDGDDVLETRLTRICSQVRAAVLIGIIPRRSLEAIVLAGGYGRGEGGVLRTPNGDRPYNDLEFYVFVRGSTLLNEHRYAGALHLLAQQLSASAGVDVEFKILSLARLRRSPVTMFSYDLVMGHRWLYGYEEQFAGCEHHRRAADIPLHEATRLLMNRCSGLLFSLERLRRPVFTADDADFVGRNLAKARLALGDVVLTATGRYHWSCRERERRLVELGWPVWSSWPWFPGVQEQYRRGVEFKLHPQRSTAPAASLRTELEEISALACRLWVWLESRQLQRRFASPGEYAASDADKCPETPRWRNWLVNLWHFGLAALWAPGTTRYPRERLLQSLPLLLWEPAAMLDLNFQRQLRHCLATPATQFSEFVAAYARLWEHFR